MWSMRSATSSRSCTERWSGRRSPATVAVCHRPAIGGRRRSGSKGSVTGSVALVPLLPPRVAAVVVSVLFPEPGLVAGHQRQPADPLGALPEVQVRHEEPDRPAVL